MSRYYPNARFIVGWQGGMPCEYGRQFCATEYGTDHMMYYNDWRPVAKDRYYLYFKFEYSTDVIKEFALCKEHWAELLLKRLNKEGVDGIGSTNST